MSAAITISARTAVQVTGMSWAWCCRFAREHGVPIYRVGERKQLLPAAAMLEAIERHAATQIEAPLTDEQEREAMRAQLGMRRIGGVR